MAHRLLKELTEGHSMWTGDAFDYIYIKTPDGTEVHLPATELYEMLEVQLRGAIIAEVELGEHDYLTLAAAFKILKDSAA